MPCIRLCVLAILQLLYLYGTAQYVNRSFIRITTSQGLSQGHVNSILKDRRGFMWFATDGGLNRYDGYSFLVFKHKEGNAASLSNDIVGDITEDKAGALWIGTGSGLDQFDRKKETFTHYRPGKDITVNDVLIDQRNSIWLGTTGGLYLFNPVTRQFSKYARKPGTSNGISDNHVYHLVEDNSGNIWIATKNGLNCFHPATQQFTVYNRQQTGGKGLPTNWIRSVYKDHAGNIWVGTIGSGIAMLDASTGQFQQYKNEPRNPNSLSNNDVLSFTEDEQHNLWIGTENGGINVFNRQRQQFTAMLNDPADQQSLSNNSIYALYRDDIGNIWAGTWSNGANMLPAVGKKFTMCTRLPGNANSLSNSSVLSIACDASNNVWIGTDGGGLNRFQPSNGTFTHYLHDAKQQGTIQNDYAITVINAADNLLAIGYHRGGVDLLDVRTGKVVKHLRINDPQNTQFEMSVNCLYKDRGGNLWVGTWGYGVMVFNSSHRLISQYHQNNGSSNSINNDFINSITEDKSGNIWIGTSGGVNLLHLRQQSVVHYVQGNGNKGLSNNEVNQVYEDAKGRIWIASLGGLDLLDGASQTFQAFKEEQGLPSSSIQSILEDDHGRLWLGTGNGMAVFDPATKKSRNFNIDDGLQGREYKNNCSFKSNNGLLFFGGTEGFNYFHPDSLKDNQFVPPVCITRFELFNQLQQPGDESAVLQDAITETSIIQLDHNQNIISFDFAALNYTYSENNRYAYMLEGFDSTWVNAGTHRTASYTNLDAGKYTFRVKASNNAGIWNEQGTALQLIIRPPFWKTWWFITCSVLAMGFLVVAFYNYRTALLQAQKKKLEAQVQQQTEALRQLNQEETRARIEAEQARKEADEANKRLLISNHEMEQFAYVASHDLNEPLRTTRNFVSLLQKKYKGRLDEKADQYLQFISDASERMKVLINDLLEFSRIGSVKQLEHINCRELLQTLLLDIDAAVQESRAVITSSELPIIVGYPTEIKLLFQNLLVNAIKFRKKDLPPAIHIAAVDKGDHWLFSVSDNGIGIDQEFQEKIFLIFQRLHPMKDYTGSGIGLAHCQRIAALHNGRIWVESQPGEGSTFYVTLQKELGQEL